MNNPQVTFRESSDTLRSPVFRVSLRIALKRIDNPDTSPPDRA